MRYTRHAFVMFAALALLGLVTPGPAVAQVQRVQADQIVVTGVVPDRRLIVVDAAGNIQQIFSNTAKDVIPAVTIGSIFGPATAFSPTMHAKYGAVMKEVHANRAVSILATRSGSIMDYPDFTGAQTAHLFTVTPSRMRGDDAALPYEISIK